MQRTNRIYEEPSRLSQGLVITLSIAVVGMAGWLAATMTLSQTATTSMEGAIDALAGAPPATSTDETSASLPTTLRQPQSTSVHFDWPKEFASTPAPTPPAQSALPLAPTELPTARDPGRGTWPATGEVRDRSLLSRISPGAAEPADAIVDILSSPSPIRGAAATPAPPARQAQRRQKPRAETEAAAMNQ
jgi:hypothetical protein